VLLNFTPIVALSRSDTSHYAVTTGRRKGIASLPIASDITDTLRRCRTCSRCARSYMTRYRTPWETIRREDIEFGDPT